MQIPVHPPSSMAMKIPLTRRSFLRSAAVAAGGAMLPLTSIARTANDPLYRLSLAEWSLNRAIFGGQLDHLDFAAKAASMGFEGVEYVNQFFKDRANDSSYLDEMKSRAEDAGVVSLLIMVDGEGNLGDPDDAARTRAIENHYKWADATKRLGGHSIRVNAGSSGTYDEQMKLAADGLRRLAEYTDDLGLYVIVENHGGLSSNGKWLAGVMEAADHPRVGTLPDFGNFVVSRDPLEVYDYYQGVEELMPYARAVSAKAYDFDEEGNETRLDFERLMRIVLDAGYRGYVGIEFEGHRLGEEQGILATKALLERVRTKLADEYSN